MCANGVDLGHSCRLCGKPLLSCWDDGPSISWHMNEADADSCAARSAMRNAAEMLKALTGKTRGESDVGPW